MTLKGTSSCLTGTDVGHFELVLPDRPSQDGLKEFDPAAERAGRHLGAVLFPGQGRDAENNRGRCYKIGPRGRCCVDYFNRFSEKNTFF